MITDAMDSSSLGWDYEMTFHNVSAVGQLVVEIWRETLAEVRLENGLIRNAKTIVIRGVATNLTYMYLYCIYIYRSAVIYDFLGGKFGYNACTPLTCLASHQSHVIPLRW